MYINVQETDLSQRDLYQLCIGVVNPRPIALVSSLAADGTPNLAPYSFFNMVSGSPPVLIICPGARRDQTHKDTFCNIRDTQEFVVNVVTDAIAGPMARSAADLPPEGSEFAFSGLTPAPSQQVKPPRVRESPVNIECRLRQIVSIGDNPGAGQVVFGDVLALHIADWIIRADGRIDRRKLRTVGRLGEKGYCTVLEPFDLTIPTVQ